MKILILGAGLVGKPMAMDLAKDSRFHVSVADIDPDAIARLSHIPGISAIRRDLSDSKGLKELVSGFDIVINALPGFMGFQTLEWIIEVKKDVVDISFFPEDPFRLDDLAKASNVTALVDCGVAPGMSNVLVGHADHQLDRTEKLEIYVGGLPEIREWPFEYKAGFSPIDVIEEYIRPARYVENGKLKQKPALSDAEYVNFSRIGTLEAFLTDGLRTLIKTIDAPVMTEKTLRYPGHIDKIKVLRESGFFGKEKVPVNGVSVRPVDVSASLLFPKWKLSVSDKDVTVMRIVVEGRKGDKRLQYTYELYDEYDIGTQVHSMARTTGYTATTALRMIAAGLFSRKGISSPEFIGRKSECVEFMLNGLRERNVNYEEKVNALE
ncbi:MAG: saccharopine dehydrogenase NADP-binding domain-containing protein [Candidatus Aminicenantes bacterium]|nr:saccharopine dehydrogenase NADP-binding domain-containing protein [Candidatus Aminicenantes bacterium]